MSYNIYKNVIKMITLPEYRDLILDSPELKEKNQKRSFRISSKKFGNENV